MKALRSLTFHNTMEEGIATLEVDRTALVDLTVYFRDLFDTYNEKRAYSMSKSVSEEYHQDLQLLEETIDDYYTITDEKSTFDFTEEQLFSIFMSHNEPEKIMEFFSDNIIYPKTPDNAFILNRMKNFKNEYQRITMLYSDSYFLIKPIDEGMKPLDIEKIIKPKTKNISQLTINRYCEFNDIRSEEDLKKKERITTRPYKKSDEEKILNILREEYTRKKVLKTYMMEPKLNIFGIIGEYNLPTDHLEIVEKNPSYNSQAQK